MSLEQALQANTEAVNALAAILAKTQLPTAAVESTVKEEPKEEPKEVKKPAKGQSSVSTPTAPDNSTTSSAESSKSEAVEKVEPSKTYDYEEVKNLVLRLNKEIGKEATVDVLSRFGAKRLPEILPEHFPALVEKINEVLTGGAV